MNSRELSRPALIAQWMVLITFIVGVALLLSYRAALAFFFTLNDAVPLQEPFLTVSVSDAGFIAGILALMALAGLARRMSALAALLVRVAVVLLLWLWCVDALVFDTFSMRLDFQDVLRYGREGGAGITLLNALIPDPTVLSLERLRSAPFMAAFALFSLLYLVVGLHLNRQGAIIVGVLVAGLLATRVYAAPPYNLKSWVYRNYMELNLTNGTRTDYSPGFERQLMQRFSDTETCGPGEGRRPDVILLIMESLSNYHSKFFSGILDWTPNLDRMARENLALTNFFANGFTTEHGLISVLTGQYFIPGVNEYSWRFLGEVGNSFPRFAGAESVAGSMDKAGYRTVFLTSGDLSFSGKGQWVASLGYDEIYGHDLKDFETWPKSHFNAAPDEVLYLAGLRILRERDKETPLFLTIETVNGHLPFFAPHGPPHTEQRVFDYVDYQLGRFYDALKESGFLDHGLLIVVGDHRAMTPVSAAETQVYGDSAPARIPAVVAGPGYGGGGPSDALLQQTDILPSLERLVSDEYCHQPGAGDLLSHPPRPTECVFHAMGGRRELIYVDCGGDEAFVELKGDDTEVVQGSVPDPGHVVDIINYSRLTHVVGKAADQAP